MKYLKLPSTTVQKALKVETLAVDFKGHTLLKHLCLCLKIPRIFTRL
jgi:hypothetical protein